MSTFQETIEFNGKRTVVLTLYGDYTDATPVNKTVLDISTLPARRNGAVTSVSVDKIEYQVQGEAHALYWDHTTDDEIAILNGEGCFDFRDFGGLHDPKSAGGTGDLILTGTGTPADGDSYFIKLYLRPKA